MRKLGYVACVVLAALSACASLQPPGSTASTAASAGSYQKLGISATTIEPREDGMRTSGARGTYEWWYFDFTLDDGSTLVITFNTKDPTRPDTPLTPILSFKLDGPDGVRVDRTLVAAVKDFHAATDRCDLTIGPCTARGDLHDYALHIELDGVTADLRLHGTVPPWRPGTGYAVFQ